jgi:acetylornithine/succinyldiaminopimelate/putrescine aminotransferase
VAQAVSPGDHGSTYGGNLLATRAAAFFLEQLMDHGLLDQVRSVGDHFEQRLRALALRHPVIVEVRGAGLMRGVELRVDATPVVDLAREGGLLINRTNEKVVRMLPPLTVTGADIDAGVEILDSVLAQVAHEVPA